MVLAYAATNQWLSFDIHYENYHQSPTSWLNAMFAWIASSLIIAYVGWRLLQQIQQRTQESDELVQQINQIANNVAGVLFKLNAPPDGEWYFSYVSEASLGVLGLSPDDMKHNIDKFSGIIHPNDREKVRLDAEQSAKKFTLWEHEFRIVSPVVGDRWMHCNANPSKGADGSIIFHGYIQDVTEQKRLQSVKEDFISVVSHELRTPLTSIKGALQLVNSGCLTETPQKVDYLLDIAEKNSIRLLFLINDLLDIEKLERESFSLKYEQVDLCSFLDTCLEENESYAAQSNMTFSRTSCKAAKLSIDIQRMKQVMANLLSNACKYSPEGEPIEISAVVETQRVVIAVKDNGPGIPPAFHDKIFDKFTQVDTSSTRSAGGTGLGLSIAKQIVELHSGSIWFETAPNEGSTFFIALPLHPSHFEEEVSL
jgi:signal transduction histidine kinase